MSRVIVKNLPTNCTEKRVRQHFREFEPLTDVSLKFTKEGVFRKFAFVGFASEAAAQKAIDKFNHTFFDTSRIAVETCLPIAEKDKIRPWSKHSKGSSAYTRLHGDESVLTEAPKASSKQKTKTPSVLSSKYASDPLFIEFLKVRGGEKIANDEEQEGNEDSTKLLLDAMENFKGERDLSLILRGLPANLKQTNLKEWLTPIRVKSAYLSRSKQETFAFVTFNRATDLRKALLRNGQFLGGYKVRICKFPNTANKESASNETQEVEEFDLEAERKRIESEILETGRLFLRNLPYMCTERDLLAHFKKFGEIVDCPCVVDRRTGNCKGFAMLTFMFPENALSAYKEMDGTVFKGRMLHILPGKEKPPEEEQAVENQPGMSIFQKKREAEKKSKANKAVYSWNTLFMGANAVAETLAEKLQMQKSEFLAGDEVNSAGVRMSLAETRLVNETREFLERNGVVLDAFSRPTSQRSDRVIIAKNLPAGIDENELRQKFEKYGTVKRFLLPPECKVTALVEMRNRVDAKKAFMGLAYSRLRSQPLYLEWAPVDVFGERENNEGDGEEEAPTTSDNVKPEQPTEDAEVKGEEESAEKESDEQPITKILVRNIPFQASTKEVRALFTAFGELKTVRLPKKAGGQAGHRGFGFVDFVSVADARKAFDALVHSTHLYGRRLVLEWSKDGEDVEEIREKTKRKLSAMQKKSMSRKQIREAIESHAGGHAGESEEEEDED